MGISCHISFNFLRTINILKECLSTSASVSNIFSFLPTSDIPSHPHPFTLLNLQPTFLFLYWLLLFGLYTFHPDRLSPTLHLLLSLFSNLVDLFGPPPPFSFLKGFVFPLDSNPWHFSYSLTPGNFIYVDKSKLPSIKLLYPKNGISSPLLPRCKSSWKHIKLLCTKLRLFCTKSSFASSTITYVSE